MDGKGREDRERGGRARLGYLSRGARVPSYITDSISHARHAGCRVKLEVAMRFALYIVITIDR